MPKVIVITGPCGVGKTTVALLLAEKLGIAILKGEHYFHGSEMWWHDPRMRNRASG